MLRYALALCLLSFAAGADEFTSYGPGPSGGSSFDTFNPADLSNVDLTNSNLTAAIHTNVTNSFVRSVGNRSGTKVHFEYTLNTSAGTQYNGIGLANASYSIANIPGYDGAGNSFIIDEAGVWDNGAGGRQTLITAPVAGDTVVIEWDEANDKLYARLWHSGAWAAGWNDQCSTNCTGTPDPVAGTGAFRPRTSFFFAAGPYYIIYGALIASDQGTLNVGATTGVSTPSTGYSWWH